MQLPIRLNDTLQQWPLDLLERRCAEEAQRFFQQQPCDAQFGHELLRRALLHQDERAWTVLYQQYQPLVAGWLKQRLRWPVSEMAWQTLIDDTFMKMRGTFARHPEKFNDYPNLNALLGLLRRCSERVIQDYVEKVKQQPVEQTLDEARCISTPTPSNSDTLWTILATLLHDEQEQLVVRYLLIEEHKPRHLYADYPQLFQDVDEINTIRERLMARLRRNPAFRQALHDLSEF